MSNDQSPPARKVIPYKKGGPRKSPFAEMAFQFSGTALDVAIQQREQGEEDLTAELSTPQPPEDAPGSVNQPAPEAVPPTRLADPETSELPQPSSRASEPEPSPVGPALTGPGIRQRRRPRRDVRLMPDGRGGSPVTEEAHSPLSAFIARWKPFLTETQIGICAHVYNNSVAVGEEYCFTSTAKLMAAVSKTERQVKTVLNQLMDWGFLVKGETLVNTPREKRGTYYKLIVDKS